MSTRNHHVTVGELQILQDLSNPNVAPGPPPLVVPFSGLQDAINSLPKFLSAHTTIQLTNVNTTATGNIRIEGFSGSMLSIQPVGTTGSFILEGTMQILFNRSRINVGSGGNITVRNPHPGFTESIIDILDCTWLSLDAIRTIENMPGITTSNTARGMRLRNTNAALGTVTVRTQGTALLVSDVSQAMLNTVSGSGNNIGLQVTNSTVYLNNPLDPALATTLLSTSNGQIVTN